MIKKTIEILDLIIGWILWILLLTPLVAYAFTRSLLNKLKKDQRNA